MLVASILHHVIRGKSDSESFLTLSDISMAFGGRGGFQALDRISLDIKRGEFVSLIGHSGCGKSTLLNVIAGLLRPTGGDRATDAIA